MNHRQRAYKVVCVGGALLDVYATTRAPWVPGQSLPGSVRLHPGGAARNVAVNLARLGYDVSLLSSVGDDALGAWLLEQTEQAGVDVTNVLRSQRSTGTFVSAGPDGGERWSIADAGPPEAIGAADLDAWRAAIVGAAIVVSDANLSEPTQRALASLVDGAAPRVLLATSPLKAPRLRPVLAGAAVIVCNRTEALSLTGLPPTLSWQALGTALLVEGVERVVLTQESAGIGVLTAEDAVLTPAVAATVVNPHGAGDAVAAIAVHALLAQLDPGQTGALAAAAAAIAVESEEATPVAIGTVLGP